MKKFLPVLAAILMTSFCIAQSVNPLTMERRSALEEESAQTIVINTETAALPAGLTPKGVFEIPEENEEEKAVLMEWSYPSYNFGIVNRGKPVSGVFSFKNTSNQPIFIQEAKGDCGCTGVEFPKEPIMPGEIAKIEATYDAKVVGPFKKSVTVRTNLDEDDEKTVLYIEGEVVWQF